MLISNKVTDTNRYQLDPSSIFITQTLLFMFHNIFRDFLISKKFFFSMKSFRNTIRESNSSDTNQAQQNIVINNELECLFIYGCKNIS